MASLVLCLLICRSLSLSHSTYYCFVTKFQFFLISCLINAFLMVLQLLHIFWSYLIIQAIFGVILHGVVRKIFGSPVPPLLERPWAPWWLLHGCREGVGELGLPNKQPELFWSHALGVVWTLCSHRPEQQLTSGLQLCPSDMGLSTVLSPHFLTASQYAVWENRNLLVCPKWSIEGAIR